MSRKFMAGAFWIVLVGAILAFAIHIEANREYRHAREHYAAAKHAEAQAAATRLDRSLGEIYENLRTLTRLPSVRKLDRHGIDLDDNGRGAIQQVYNNLANSVAVSEVYFLPADFDPGRFDPFTGRLEEPILMFDQLIVDAGSNRSKPNPFASHRAASLAGPEIPEVEIYEYREFVQQLAWLKAHYPDASSVNGLDLPMISGREVITCDNTVFIKTRRDADRLGMLFSVPFFGLDGKLKGTVSAIIRSGALRGLLPAKDYALLNPANRYTLLTRQSGQESLSAANVESASPDPALIYSEVLPLSAHDPVGQWSLWAGHPNSAFFDGAEARAVRYFELSGYGVVALLVLGSLACWALVLRNAALQKSASEVLEKRVEERTAEINHMALHDALTGVPNRVMLRRKIGEALEKARRGETFAVLWLDLDNFKNVNDTLGHAAGDTLLKAATARMRACARELDTVARVGGDEFVIVQRDIDLPRDGAILAQRIIERFAEPIDIEGHQVAVGVSIGIAVAPADGGDAETILRNADIALYRAKLDGRATYRYFEAEMDIEMQERRRIELGLAKALAANEFVLHYQPLVDAATGNISGFEALVRWRHPERGLVGPGEFIRIAEETGIIVPLGEWIIRQACMDAAAWPNPMRVAVNLSPVQFKSNALAAGVVKALDRSGLASSRLELEITESVLLMASEQVTATLHQLRGLGVRIAMDDFGAGCSSLSYLRSFPFDKIKIDRSFISDIPESRNSLAIVKAITALGASLGLPTTAEGVETAEQLREVREQGCTEVQGFYFSRPVPVSDVWGLIEGKAIAAA